MRCSFMSYPAFRMNKDFSDGHAHDGAEGR